MMRNIFVFLLLLIALACSVYAADPTNLSLKGVVDWVSIGGQYASGTGALPAVATEGARYTDLTDLESPKDYRSTNGSWTLISGSTGTSTSTGVATHSELAGLGFAESGHTGFASETHTHTDYASSTHTHTEYASSTHVHAGFEQTKVNEYSTNETRISGKY